MRRLEEHNDGTLKTVILLSYRPWIMKALFQVSESRGEARKIETYLKRLKSRKLIEKLINSA